MLETTNQILIEAVNNNVSLYAQRATMAMQPPLHGQNYLADSGGKPLQGYYTFVELGNTNLSHFTTAIYNSKIASIVYWPPHREISKKAVNY